MGCVIIGCGKALPQRAVTNDELSVFLDTSDEWIVKRTGIHERHIAVEETTTDLAARAARAALGIDQGGWNYYDEPLDPATIDLVICMTMTSDMVIPSQAALLRRALRLNRAAAFDMNAACAGCIYGLVGAEALLTVSAMAKGGRPRRNPLHRVLIVGVDRMSRIMDWTDRTSCVLFGDGAGAIVMEWRDDEPGILSNYLVNTDDDEGDLICGNAHDMTTFPFDETGIAGSGGWIAATMPPAPENDGDESDEDMPWYRAGKPFIEMNGQHVFKFATRVIVDALQEALARADLTVDDLSCIVPHQANERIITAAAKKIGLPISAFVVNIASVGNTSAASVPIALCDAYVSGRIEPGDNVALLGFGGGFTAGAVIFQSL